MTDGKRARVHLLIDLAICAGALSVVVTMFSVALWADWIIEINADHSSLATPDILGRQLEMIALAGLTVATSLVALVARQREGGGPELTASVGFGSALLIAMMIGMHWQRGFYFHLEHSGALAALVLAVLQAALLMGAGAVRTEPRIPTPE
jgi:hypothetical protein